MSLARTTSRSRTARSTTSDVGINFRSSMHHVTVRRNHVHDTGADGGYSGEGLYVGCNDGSCAVSESVIENNWIHDTLLASQGDGIEIKLGSWGNVVRDNVIYNTKYPGILLYGTMGNPRNMVERNVLWNSGTRASRRPPTRSYGTTSFSIRPGNGFNSQDHNGVTPNRIEFVNNTIVGGSPVLRLSNWANKQGMVLANNAIYSTGGYSVGSLTRRGRDGQRGLSSDHRASLDRRRDRLWHVDGFRGCCGAKRLSEPDSKLIDSRMRSTLRPMISTARRAPAYPKREPIRGPRRRIRDGRCTGVQGSREPGRWDRACRGTRSLWTVSEHERTDRFESSYASGRPAVWAGRWPYSAGSAKALGPSFFRRRSLDARHVPTGVDPGPGPCSPLPANHHGPDTRDSPAQRPEAGALRTLVDPLYGTCLRRISDVTALGYDHPVPMYSQLQAWNADQSKIILVSGDILNADYTFYKRVYVGNFRWSPIYPNIGYYSESNSFQQIDISAGQSGPQPRPHLSRVSGRARARQRGRGFSRDGRFVV